MQEREKNKNVFQEGLKKGYFLGKKKLISSQYRKRFPTHHMHVFFVESNVGDSHASIEFAIKSTLKQMVEQLTVSHCGQSLTEQIMNSKPDLVFVYGQGGGTTSEILEEIQHIRSKGIPVALWLVDDPYFTDQTVQIVKYFDFVFTIDRACIEIYRSEGCSAYYLPLAAFYGQYYPTKKFFYSDYDVGFIGVGFRDRVTLLDSVFSRVTSPKKLIIGPWWNDHENFRQKLVVSEWINTERTNQYYNSMKIVLNIHRSVEDHEINKNKSMKLFALSPNVRTFEICAAGAFQLTDIREDLAKHYTPGIEIETYTSQEELLEKIDYYLEHEEEREAIALRGLKRTLREHTYGHRMDQMLNIIFSKKYEIINK